MEREFNLVHAQWQFPANFNVAPSTHVPAVRFEEGAVRGALLRWGLVPSSRRRIAFRLASETVPKWNSVPRPFY